MGTRKSQTGSSASPDESFSSPPPPSKKPRLSDGENNQSVPLSQSQPQSSSPRQQQPQQSVALSQASSSSSSNRNPSQQTIPIGSIVRIKMENFLSYDDCEFRPDSGMNFVLGLNGSYSLHFSFFKHSIS